MKRRRSILLVTLFAFLFCVMVVSCGENDQPSDLSTPVSDYDTYIDAAEVDRKSDDEIEDIPILEVVDLGCHVVDIPVRETALLGSNSVTHVYNDFIMTLNTDKETYSTSDIIRIWGTLEYVGDNESIEIWHGCPFMLFDIAGGDEFCFGENLYGASTDILVSSILERGRVYHFEYRKEGGWSGDDPKAEFWENFFNEEDLVLPVGEYTITLHGAFSLSGDDVMGTKSGLRVELRFVVVE